ncbi:MAG: hypothetical protein D6715_02050 [Calditrichaeota bacterium]|nr:MAG: hypothetical protein D6715_02050 [Calditrichota bacterium]
MENRLKIQKQIYLSIDDASQQKQPVPPWQALLAEEPLLSAIEPAELNGQLLSAPYRSDAGRQAFILRLELSETVIGRMFPDLDSAAARWLALETLAGRGWEAVPQPDQVCYLHAELRRGELESWLLADLGFRHYRMRNQLLPNITRHYSRFIVAYPDVLAHLAESFSAFPGRCYVLTKVVQRMAGRAISLKSLAEQNNLDLETPEQVPRVLQALAGRQILLAGKALHLEPVDWPVHPPDLRTADQNLSAI